MKKKEIYSIIKFACDVTQGKFIISTSWSEDNFSKKIKRKYSDQIAGVIFIKEKKYKQKRRYAKNLKKTLNNVNKLFLEALNHDTDSVFNFESEILALKTYQNESDEISRKQLKENILHVRTDLTGMVIFSEDSISLEKHKDEINDFFELVLDTINEKLS